MLSSSMGKYPTVAPYSGAMLAIVALSAIDSCDTPAPKNSTNLPTTPMLRKCCNIYVNISITKAWQLQQVDWLGDFTTHSGVCVYWNIFHGRKITQKNSKTKFMFRHIIKKFQNTQGHQASGLHTLWHSIWYQILLDAFHVPDIKVALDSLRGTKYFATFDLQSGYVWQIKIG